MDVLADVLDALELRGWLSSRTEVASPWRFDFAPSRDIVFHILSFGGGYLRVEGEATPRQVGDGDIMVFPRGHAHALSDTLAAPPRSVVQLDYDADREYQVFPFEGAGPRIVMLCGAFHLEHPDAYPLLRWLPDVVHIPGAGGHMAPGCADIVRLLAQESEARRAGAGVVLRRLAEVLFIQVIRAWIEEHAPATGGGVAALRDPRIGAALGLIHRHPERGWKVEDLADAVGLSRSAFSARFANLVGEPPAKYLVHWRMQRARRLLRDDVGVEAIARQLGYESEVAFRKAFRREVGVPPARYRRAASA